MKPFGELSNSEQFRELPGLTVVLEVRSSVDGPPTEWAPPKRLSWGTSLVVQQLRIHLPM